MGGWVCFDSRASLRVLHVDRRMTGMGIVPSHRLAPRLSTPDSRGSGCATTGLRARTQPEGITRVENVFVCGHWAAAARACNLKVP